MIAIVEASARRAPLALASVSIAFGPGVHAILGGRDEGGPLLLAIIAGAERLRSGRVRVLDAAPDDPRVRSAVAWVRLPAPLPEGLKVHEVLHLGEKLRGEAHQPAELRLSALGLESLARRPVSSLSRAEARGVALVEGMTSARVRVLLIEEPLLVVDPRAAPYLPAALRARARDGRAVVVTTGSTGDAALLADDHVLLRGGRTLGPSVSPEALLGVAVDGVWVRVHARTAGDARRLLTALGDAEDDPVIDAVEQDGPSLRARGRDPAAMARAVARAAMTTRVDLLELRFGPPELEATSALPATRPGTIPPTLAVAAPAPPAPEPAP